MGLQGPPGSPGRVLATSGLSMAASAKDAIMAWASNVSASQQQEHEHERALLAARADEQERALAVESKARQQAVSQLAQHRAALRRSRRESEALAQQVLALQAQNLQLHEKVRTATQMLHQTVVQF